MPLETGSPAGFCYSQSVYTPATSTHLPGIAQVYTVAVHLGMRAEVRSSYDHVLLYAAVDYIHCR